MVNAFDIEIGDVVLCIDSQMGRYKHLFRVIKVQRRSDLHHYIIHATNFYNDTTVTFYDDEIIHYIQQEIF